jgi:hypothetical protein
MISRPTVASLLLVPAFREQRLGTATGFVVTHDDVNYLVTNFHIVSGRRPNDLTATHPSGAWPDRIEVAQNAAGNIGRWLLLAEPLYDESGAPRWLEHPIHSHRADVVALPLLRQEGIDLFPHDPWAPLRMAMPMATPLSIVGFPFGQTGGGAFALWVQGFVASEPAIDFDGLPVLLIDSRTRPGQSGSPVLNYNSGGSVPHIGGGTAIFSGEVTDFVGVYSGRINEQSDLGFVWKAAAVREIIEGGVLASVPGPS